VDFSQNKVKKIILTLEIAEFKIKNWCAYQERSQNEVRLKLFDFGLNETDVETLISKLINENFLNEERFSVAFAGGKFRIKRWGKNKIKFELRRHKVSEYCINKALNSLNHDDYLIILESVLEKKIKQIKSSNSQKTFFTVLNYAISRGFERDIVTEKLNKLLN
jgi:regulatory protein